MTHAFVIANNKGGTGKTTSAVNIAHALARDGQSVLLMDNDPQSQIATWFGKDPSDGPGMEELYATDQPLREVLTELRGNLWGVLSKRSLSALVADLHEMDQYSSRLSRHAHDVAQFDIVIIDCGPSLNPLTVCAFELINELIASHGADGGLVVPVGLSTLDLAGAAEQRQVLDNNWKEIAPPVVSYIPTVYRKGTNLHERNLEALRENLNGGLTRPVRISIRLQEAPMFGETIFEHDPSGRGSEDYAAIAHQLVQ